MARKPTNAAAKIPAPTTNVKPPVNAVVTPVRNTVVPPKAPAIAAAPAPIVRKSAPTYDAVATRAYFIWKSTGNSQLDNWLAAERELSV